ncbi:hypothetical protein SteCoe_5131 [Stentor coeruleus]|uniref:dual-specificity kinase n=1 Tax=Stentor coeruleus TaxID=5963 RepID=A0A1R2CT47_9CILI|nr:hypothetical protein SteCoe_5131 [Stentor coeruleus]
MFSKRNLSLKEFEIEESSSEAKLNTFSNCDTLAQKIPKLPESKFFPSNGRTINLPSNPSKAFQTLSANTSTAIINNSSSIIQPNLSLQQVISKDHLINFSQFSQTINQNEQIYKWTDLELPTTPVIVLSKFPINLTSYEQSEILKYPQIWFIGLDCKKPEPSRIINDNYGFDDESGDYKAQPHDHIAYRYEIHESLGRGSFGQVYRVFDFKHKTFCALKIIKNKRRFTQQAMVEVDILKHLRKKDEHNISNIVHIQSSFNFRNHICICFEMLSMNLYHFLKFNRFQGLSLNLIKRFALQILQALVLLQQNKIIHCDLKPENILLKQSNRSAIKVIDFGSSCFSDKKIYTYIQSRFYRAPEVILGMPYTTAIDMWSFGCILVELYTGFPIFPGENETQQLMCIMEYLGVPPYEYLHKATRRKTFFDSEFRPRVATDSKGKMRKPGTKRIGDLLNTAEESFVRLVECCFVWEPNFRITPQQGLISEWITDTSKLPSKVHGVSESKTCKNSQKKKILFD